VYTRYSWLETEELIREAASSADELVAELASRLTELFDLVEWGDDGDDTRGNCEEGRQSMANQA